MVAEFSIIPLGSGVSISKYAAIAASIIGKSGLYYHTNSMATVVEGDADEIFALGKKCQRAVMGEVSKVMVSINIANRKSKKSPRIEKNYSPLKKRQVKY